MRASKVSALAVLATLATGGVAAADDVLGTGRTGHAFPNEFVFAARSTTDGAEGTMSFVGTNNMRVLSGPPECVKVEGNVANVVWAYDDMRWGQNSGDYVGNLSRIEDNAPLIVDEDDQAAFPVTGFGDRLTNAALDEASYEDALAECLSAAPPEPPTTGRLAWGDIRVNDGD